MSYRIKKYTFSQAKKLGVEVKPSSVEGKKIDVFKKGEKVASVGALGMNDYPTYMELERDGKVENMTYDKAPLRKLASYLPRLHSSSHGRS